MLQLLHYWLFCAFRVHELLNITYLQLCRLKVCFEKQRTNVGRGVVKPIKSKVGKLKKADLGKNPVNGTNRLIPLETQMNDKNA